MLLELGERRYDLAERPLVMGILNRTPDSFFDAGEYWGFDDFLAKAERLWREGADILDVGGVKAAPGSEVTAGEELERVVPAIEALAARFDVALSVDTWRASVAEAAYAAGAVLGNDISGFADPDFLPVAAAAGAAVVACHVRLAPRYADPDPVYEDLLGEVRSYLAERASWADFAGLGPTRVLLDAGLDLGKTPAMSAALLRRGDHLAALGYPILLSASNKGFLGWLCGTEVGERRAGSIAAHALGSFAGCGVIRAHDVRGTRRVVEVATELRRRSGGWAGGTRVAEATGAVP
ncbi:MAG: dihydropteroate synthase [bacterium]|nr:dihydropteroate synthase [bacterium]MXV91815.1 dihydropteroate synthase [Acidimicrobiia bacterium]MYC46125.1 dihydropteroate synthase [Acidimicrobiia bacterium]